MPPTIPFNQLLEIIETLSPEELDDLINIVRKRQSYEILAENGTEERELGNLPTSAKFGDPVHR